MKGETKIILNKNDGLETVVDKVIHAPTFAVILSIPRESVLIHSLSNFNALKRESDTAGKALMIESSDERVHELAARAKIVASNPPKASARPSMDIVRRDADEVPKARAAGKSTAKSKKEEKEEIEFIAREAKQDDVLEEKATTFFKPIAKRERIDLAEANIESVPHIEKLRKKHWPIFLVAGALFAGIAWYAIAELPRATITLFVKHEAVDADDTVKIGTAYKEASVSSDAILIPGELFSEKGNFSMSFPANGTQNVETRATGKLVVYNAYSAAAQPLLKSTRFESPDGKVFRLDKAVTIPGAKSVKGKLVPASLEVLVTADKAGDEYNIAPAAKWTIPGFKGTPRFNGFYADSLEAMTGGAIGLRPTLSDADRKNAEDTVGSALQSSLGMRILAMADKFKTFASSTSFTITKTEERVNKDEAGKFDMYMEGVMKQLVFDENMLRDAVVKKARTDNTVNDVVDFVRVNYGEPKFDFDNGTIVVGIKSSVSFSPNISLEEIKKSVLGSTKSAAEMTILGIPRLDSANIAFWPFWVNSVPSRESRVEVLVK